MKQHMNEINWNFIVLVCLGLIIGWFYWFQYRPAQARKFCHNSSVASAQNLLKQTSDIQNQGQEYAKKGLFYQKDYDYFYNSCLNMKGIN